MCDNNREEGPEKDPSHHDDAILCFMVHNCTCSICIIAIAMANSTKIIKTYMPSARLVLPSTTFVSLQSLLPKIPSCTSYLPTVLCPCMLVETNGEEGRRCKAKTKEGLGHRSRKDHSSCSSGVSGWDVWYPFFLRKASFTTCVLN